MQKRKGTSIRMKTTLLTVGAIVAAMTVFIIISVVFINRIGLSDAQKTLRLLCQAGEKNLDYYFSSVEQSVEMVSSYVSSDLAATDLDHLSEHIERTRVIFGKTAVKTTGVMTYYYRIDPAVSATDKGFWYIAADGTNTGDDPFIEHEVTDINLYDTADTSALKWFTVPKTTGKSIWLPSYVTENLDARVISYNVPIYRAGTFIGVVGIEIDYTTLATEVNSIKSYTSGYAFVCDNEGTIVYHPQIDVLRLADNNKLQVPEGLISSETVVEYQFNGVRKQGVWEPLSNGMRLVVTVPVAEINAEWKPLIHETVIAGVVLLIVFVFVTIIFSRHFTKPLRKLADNAEEVRKGNYDVNLNYKGNDEIGTLTGAFNHLIDHLRSYIADLNSLAYGDALTSVRNKGAFDIYVREIQALIDDPTADPSFAIGIFDCDNLKVINDTYGHDKGDMYLTNSSHLICRVFQNSPVFRIGGDEFAVILQNEDYQNRETLARRFREKSAEICSFAKGPWEEIKVAMGIATYTKLIDYSVEDVIQRADKLMYEDKRRRKNA